jgi:hypothetical protein
MDAKRLLTGTLVGAVTQIIVGGLIFRFFFSDFYAANSEGVPGISRDVVILWAAILGHCSLACLLTLAVWKMDSATLLRGMMVGAVVGFLAWFGFDFIQFAATHRFNLTATILDPFLEIVRMGASGAMIGLVLGKLSQE